MKWSLSSFARISSSVELFILEIDLPRYPVQRGLAGAVRRVPRGVVEFEHHTCGEHADGDELGRSACLEEGVYGLEEDDARGAHVVRKGCGGA